MTAGCPLQTVYVHVTDSCNLACLYCCRSAGSPSEGELTAAELASLWREVVALEPAKVVITGGEPCMRPDLLALLESYRQADPARRVRCCLNTNGTLVTPLLAQRIASLVDEVRMSVGHDWPAGTTAGRRGQQPGAEPLEVAWPVLEVFREAGIEVVAMVPVTRCVLAELPRLLEQIHRAGITRIKTLVLRRTGRARELDDILPTYGQIASALAGFTADAPTRAAGNNRNCGVGRFLSIAPNGDAYPCHVLTAPEFRLGNVRRDRLASICAAGGLLQRLQNHKVILATDADVDGLHIRNLLLTFFLRFFEPIIQEGHVHILETPLFRVRNSKQTVYCYSETERDASVKELRGAEVTRFKGLGEISPGEFKRFIGPEMRLTPVRLANRHSVPAILGFYMGRNTPERRQYIMNHLVVESES